MLFFASLLLATDSCLIHINIYKLIKSLKEWAYRIALTFHNENLMLLKKKNIRTMGPFSGHTYQLSLKHLHTKDGVCVVCFPHYPIELKGKNYSWSLLQILDKHCEKLKANEYRTPKLSLPMTDYSGNYTMVSAEGPAHSIRQGELRSPALYISDVQRALCLVVSMGWVGWSECWGTPVFLLLLLTRSHLLIHYTLTENTLQGF